MAAQGTGKAGGGKGAVLCPKCGARSTQTGLGTEPNRVSGGCIVVPCADTGVTKRREKAASLRKKNLSNGVI